MPGPTGHTDARDQRTNLRLTLEESRYVKAYARHHHMSANSAIALMIREHRDREKAPVPDPPAPEPAPAPAAPKRKAPRKPPAAPVFSGGGGGAFFGPRPTDPATIHPGQTSVLDDDQ